MARSKTVRTREPLPSAFLCLLPPFRYRDTTTHLDLRARFCKPKAERRCEREQGEDGEVPLGDVAEASLGEIGDELVERLQRRRRGGSARARAVRGGGTAGGGKEWGVDHGCEARELSDRAARRGKERRGKLGASERGSGRGRRECRCWITDGVLCLVGGRGGPRSK